MNRIENLYYHRTYSGKMVMVIDYVT